MSENRLTYRLDEVVRLTGLSRATLYRLAAKNELPFIKVCGRTLVARLDLEAMVDRMRERNARLA
jgi:excisionase family DNA binding protein